MNEETRERKKKKSNLHSTSHESHKSLTDFHDGCVRISAWWVCLQIFLQRNKKIYQHLYVICKYCRYFILQTHSNMRKDPHAHTTDTSTYMYTHTHARMHAHVRAHTHTHTYAHTCIQPHHTTNHTHSHKHAHTYQHTHACMHIHTHAHMHTHTHTRTQSEEDMALTKAKTCACSLSTLLEPLPTHRYRHSQQSSSITSSGTRSSCSAQNTHNIALLLRPHIPPFSTKHTRHCTASSSTHPTLQHKTHTSLHCFFVHTSHPSAQNTHVIALLLRPHIPPFSTKHTRHCTASSSTHPTLQHKTHTSLHCFFVHTSHPSAQNTHVIALLLRPHIPPFSTKHTRHCTASSSTHPTLQHKTHTSLHCFFVHTSHPSAQNTCATALLLHTHGPLFSTKHTMPVRNNIGNIIHVCCHCFPTHSILPKPYSHLQPCVYRPEDPSEQSHPKSPTWTKSCSSSALTLPEALEIWKRRGGWLPPSCPQKANMSGMTNRSGALTTGISV